MDYADGLARLRRPQAPSYFEQALAANPGNNLEAINRYAVYLLDRGDARAALGVLETLSSTDRVASWLPVFLRKEALDALQMDSRSADREIAELETRSQGAIGGTMRRSEVTAARHRMLLAVYGQHGGDYL